MKYTDRQAVRTAGSPPPTRGTPFLDAKNCVDVGITPAYAGNTKNQGHRSNCTGDHPRLRGEHKIQATETPQFEGSPPPTRGTLE